MYRAQQAAVQELRAVGIPDTSIDGGLEHNGLIQIEKYGYINDPRIHMPAKSYIAQHPNFPGDCKPEKPGLTPAIVPGYALSFDPSVCRGLSHFAPVTYRTWLLPHTIPIYIVNTEGPRSGSH
jgi:hypothetical protein